MPVRFLIRVKERGGRKWYLTSDTGLPVTSGYTSPSYSKEEVDGVIERFMRAWPDRVYSKRATWFGGKEDSNGDV